MEKSILEMARGAITELTARNTIKAYLEEQLKDCTVTVML